MVVEQMARRDVRAEVVDAATRLLRDGGARAVTTRAVAEAAGVQAPTIYRLFGDKDGLLDAVAEHVMETYVGAKVAASAGEAGGDPLAQLRAAWHLHGEFGLANPELYALLSAPGRAAPSPASAAGLDVLRARVRRLAEAGLLRVDEQRAVELIHAAGTGTVLTLLAAPPEARDRGLSPAMLEAVLAAVLGEAPSGRGDGLSALAVTFATVVPELPALSDAERALLSEWVGRSVAALQAGS